MQILLDGKLYSTCYIAAQGGKYLRQGAYFDFHELRDGHFIKTTRHAVCADGSPGAVLGDYRDKPPVRSWKRKSKSWSARKVYTNCNLILKDIERLIEGEFGGRCETDDGELLFEQAAPLLVARHIAYGRPEETLNIMAWASALTPKLAAENGREWFQDVEQRIIEEWDNYNGRPSIPDRDDVSKALGITIERRAASGLKHLPAIERPPAVRKREAKQQNAAHNKGKRIAAGATPREESITARQPWLAYGISKRTYERRVERGDIPADPVTLKRQERAKAKRQPVLRLVSCA